MKLFCSAPSRHWGPSPSRGSTLIELVISAALIAVIVALALAVMVQGSRNLRTYEQALEAQKAGLTTLTRLHKELQATNTDLMLSTPQGIVFPSPYRDTGGVEYDPSSLRLLWQEWICYEYQSGAGVLTRRILPISPATDSPGAPPPVVNFATSTENKVQAREVSSFALIQETVTPPLWRCELTLGDMTDASRYGIELEIKVTPRN